MRETTPTSLVPQLLQILEDLKDRGVKQIEVDGEVVMWDHFAIYLDQTRPILQVGDRQEYAKTTRLVQEIYEL